MASNIPQINDIGEPPAKRRKSVEFAKTTQTRHIDAEDGSVLKVEARELVDSDDEDAISPASGPSLDRTARRIDKKLYFLPGMSFEEFDLGLEEDEKKWSYKTLCDLLKNYRFRMGKTPKNMNKFAKHYHRRTSSVLFALSRIFEKIEELEERRQLEHEEGDVMEESPDVPSDSLQNQALSDEHLPHISESVTDGHGDEGNSVAEE